MNLSNVARRLESSEGRILHLYKCTGGVVTAAIGHALETVDEARSIRWMVGDRPATDEEIRRDYDAVSKSPVGYKASWYAKLTKIRIVPEEIDRLAQFDIKVFSRQIRVRLPEFDTYPNDAQEALFDMAFNLGTGGLMKFKKMIASVKARQWAAAASQCNRKGISAERNEETVELFQSAARTPSDLAA